MDEEHQVNHAYPTTITANIMNNSPSMPTSTTSSLSSTSPIDYSEPSSPATSSPSSPRRRGADSSRICRLKDCKTLYNPAEPSADETSLLLQRLRKLAVASVILSSFPFIYCLVVVHWVQLATPLLSFNCGLFSLMAWGIAYLGYKGAMLRSPRMLWTHCVGSIVGAIGTLGSIFFFFPPGILLSHFIATADYPKDGDKWVLLVICVTIMVVGYVLAIIALHVVYLYSAFLSFCLSAAVKHDAGKKKDEMLENFMEAGVLPSNLLDSGDSVVLGMVGSQGGSTTCHSSSIDMMTSSVPLAGSSSSSPGLYTYTMGSSASPQFTS